MRIIELVKNKLACEKGAFTTTEIILYTLIFGGAATTVGFAITAATRGLGGQVVKAITN